MNQRCTAALLQTAIEELRSKMKKADGPPRPGFDKLLRGCEVWRAELTERLERGGHEYYGTGLGPGAGAGEFRRL